MWRWFSRLARDDNVLPKFRRSVGTIGTTAREGRDAILTMKDGLVKFATAEGDQTFPGSNVTAPYFTAVRDALDHWQRGAPPPISVHDCVEAVRLIDQAYEQAGLLATGAANSTHSKTGVH